MRHALKIHQHFLIRLLGRQRTFEVRFNDRDYQVGDTIVFLPSDSDKCDVYAYYDSPLPDFKITYVHSGLGVQEGYIVLSVEPVSQPEKIYG
jgi:hypothetical protein